MREIPITKGKRIIVDDADFDRVIQAGPWIAHSKAGAYRTIRRGNNELVHRFLLGLSSDDHVYVDHINGDALDNRRANLRLASHSENLCNSKTPSHNTSGCKGISWSKVMGRWHAYINLHKTRHTVGYFDCKLEAFMVLAAKRAELHGRFACHGAR